MAGKKKGLYANINAKKKRIAAGSGEKMRKVGSKGAPKASDFKKAAKTAKKRQELYMFKPCAGCKTKMACKKAGKCLAKRKAPQKKPATTAKRQYKRK